MPGNNPTTESQQLFLTFPTVKLCECGCGQPAPIAQRDRPSKGLVRGQPMRFVWGHNHRAPATERFWKFVDKDGPVPEGRADLGPCWLWTGHHSTRGYGYFWGNGKEIIAARFAYESEYGKVPEGLELDHLCKTPPCIRPSHLEPVTHKVNVLRGEGVSAMFARRTHCARGHDLTIEGAFYYARTKNGFSRRCKRCHMLHCKEQYQKRKAK
jgi:hypothetical protein